MANLNRVYLLGNLTKDPEVRYLPSGTALCDLRLAVSEGFKNKQGDEITCFVDVVVWEKQAEACGEYLSKGSPVLVEGRLQLDEWKSKEGENRSKLRVRASRVQFLGSPRGAEFRDQPGDSAPPRRPEPEEAPPVEAQPGHDSVEDDDNLPF